MGHAPRWVQWISLPLSIAALGIAAWQSWDTHVSTKRALQPLLAFDLEDDPEQFPFGIMVENDGAGPAIIKSVTYYVDNLPIEDVDKVIAAAKLNSKQTDTQLFDRDDALGVGRNMWLLSRSKRNRADTTEANKFADFLGDHLDVKINYCSLAGDCFTKCSTPDHCSAAPAKP